jgi:hypothetical protein
MRLSVSKIKAFKACRRLYQLKYVEGLEPVKKPETLETGTNYHSLLEELHNVGNLNAHDGECTKELAMAKAYERYVYPKMHVVASEKWLEYDLGGVKFVGIVDAIADDGHIVEHKITGSEITEEYEYNLLWDEQILAYMMLTGKRKVWYTVCRKPTIRQKQAETDEEFFKRMVAWYDVDTGSKIRLLEIERTDDEVEAFRKDLEVIKGTIQEAEEDKNFYRNTCHCHTWGRRCEYSSVCLHYDPTQSYIEFERR